MNILCGGYLCGDVEDMVSSYTSGVLACHGAEETATSPILPGMWTAAKFSQWKVDTCIFLAAFR